jgi:hypothetical protein
MENQERKNGFSPLFLIGLIAAVAVIAVGGLAFTLWSNSRPAPDSGKIADEKPIGGDKDEHDCLVAAGYSWCSAKNKCLRAFEEFCPDVLAALVRKLEEESGVVLKAGGEKKFSWAAEADGAIVQADIDGLAYSAEGVKRADYDKMEKYLERTYQPDARNEADGPDGGIRGYAFDYTACHLSFRQSQMKPNADGVLEPASDSLKVELACGYFNPNDIGKLSTAEKIKVLLAEKYGKKADEVAVKITKSDDSHAAGSVKFSPDPQMPGGLFLAIKEGEAWKLVYDGNGSIDCEKMRTEYGFSDELLKPNFCE